MPPLRVTFDQGISTRKNKYELAAGECQQITGLRYKPGDPVGLHTINGSTAFGAAPTAQEMTDIALCQFDNATDKILAMHGAAIWKADLGLTGTWTSLGSVGGLTMKAAQYLDRWYLGFGTNRGKVLESSGSIRDWGMLAPTFRPTIAEESSLAEVDAASSTGDFSDEANAYDADQDTYARGLVDPDTATATQTYSFDANTGSGRLLYVTYQVDFGAVSRGRRGALGEVGYAGSQASWGLRIRTNENGAGWVNYLNITSSPDSTTKQQLVIPVTDGDPALDTANLQLEIQLSYVDGSIPVTLRVFDVRVLDPSGSGSATYSADNLYYAVAEYNEDTGMQSYIGLPATISISSKPGVTLTWTDGANNTDSTHWLIYRTGPNGAFPSQLGLVTAVPIATKTWTDIFTVYDETEQPERLLPLLAVSAESGTPDYYPRDAPPPSIDSITEFKGLMVGISDANELRYSMAGLPESWPEIYTVQSFGGDDKDNLIDMIEMSGALLVFGDAALWRIDELPQMYLGQFTPGSLYRVKGAPGIVGRRALTSVSIGGQSFAAWIAPDGVYLTNGQTFDRISDDLTWDSSFGTSTSRLHWDGVERELWLITKDSDGLNTVLHLFHMDADHRKANKLPKVTGPHTLTGGVSCIAQVWISDERRIFTGNQTDYKLYVQDYGDPSGFTIIDGRRRQGWNEWAVIDGFLEHSDFGTGETVSLTYKTGRDSSQRTLTPEAKSVSLAGFRRTQVDLQKSGDWHEINLVSTSTETGVIYGMHLEADALDRSGKTET